MLSRSLVKWSPQSGRVARRALSGVEREGFTGSTQNLQNDSLDQVAIGGTDDEKAVVELTRAISGELNNYRQMKVHQAALCFLARQPVGSLAVVLTSILRQSDRTCRGGLPEPILQRGLERCHADVPTEGSARQRLKQALVAETSAADAEFIKSFEGETLALEAGLHPISFEFAGQRRKFDLEISPEAAAVLEGHRLYPSQGIVVDTEGQTFRLGGVYSRNLGTCATRRCRVTSSGRLDSWLFPVSAFKWLWEKEG